MEQRLSAPLLDESLVQAILATERFFHEPIPTVPFPTWEVLLQPLPRCAFPTNVPTNFLALDPLVLLNFLMLGSKNIRKRI